MRYNHLVSHFGSCAKAAKALAKNRQTVNRWKDTGIPEDAQIEIHIKTGGKLKADRPIIVKYQELLALA